MMTNANDKQHRTILRSIAGRDVFGPSMTVLGGFSATLRALNRDDAMIGYRESP